MNPKIIGNKRALDHAGVAPATPVLASRSVRIDRFHLNRGTHHLENAIVAKFVSMRAHNSVLSPAGMALRPESPVEQQQTALNTWEDEGGQVRLKYSAKLKNPG